MEKYTNLKDIPSLTYLVVFGLGIWGSILNFIKRDAEDKNMSLFKKIVMFIIELITTTGISIIIFMGMIGIGFNELLSVGLAGFIAHQGTNSIYLIELVIAEKLRSKALLEEIQKDKGEKDGSSK